MVTSKLGSPRALLGALALGVLALPAATSPPPSTTSCRNGPAAGTWRLPATPAGRGFVDGWLLSPTAPGGFHLTATLTDVPTPCLSCLEGRIQGTLDDGIGPGPDFVVLGRYTGAFLSAEGTFEVRIVSPAATGPHGRVVGQFRDPWADNLPGTFRGRWEICP